jgi:hypothetical protein
MPVNELASDVDAAITVVIPSNKSSASSGFSDNSSGDASASKTVGTVESI